MNDLEALTSLKEDWQKLQPLQVEARVRLWRKLRLEWNYHSNHIEGNTLTYGETELLLLHDRTTGDHTHREYLEMKAHDAGIAHAVALAEDSSRLIAEADVRDLNRIILKEPYWKPAETAEGQATRKEIIPGHYKTSPNNVRLQSGEMFYFASVEDTPPKMEGLLKWVHAELTSPRLHPVVFAAKLHHAFVLIHPFDDGNGRVARFLANYVLMRSGYLPLIVPTEEKQRYLTALRLADAGELEALTNYFRERAQWSLNLGLKAASGESIEALSDIEKEIAIFVREQSARASGEPPPKTPELVHRLLELSIEPWFELVSRKLTALNPLFGQAGTGVGDETMRLARKAQRRAAATWGHTSPANDVEEVFQFFGYKGESKTPFDLTIFLRVALGPSSYGIQCGNEELACFDYSHPMTSHEAEALAVKVLKMAFAQIQQLSGMADTSDMS